MLVDLPEGAKPIECKWIFKKKMKADGTVDKLKERLVAKRFSQKQGIDYFDTCSSSLDDNHRDVDCTKCNSQAGYLSDGCQNYIPEW